MKLQSYDELLHSKYRLSLLLFLALNLAASLFCCIPGTSLTPTTPTFPAIVIAISSALLLFALFFLSKLKLALLTLVSFFMGALWAWHITDKYLRGLYIDGVFLLFSLITIFFISAIALSDYLLAFCLHIAPASSAVLVLDQGEHRLLILFTLALPLIGFTLQHMMRRRSDRFTRQLVQQLYAEKESYSDLSMLDPLTGLYNRRGLKNRLANLPGDGTSNHFVLLLDIDHFKAYNDNYGHAMGDQALARVSVAIRDAVRSRDIVVRYGGEEFLVLLTNVNAAIAMKLAERIRQYVLNLEIPHLFNDRVATHVTLSAGIAPLNEAGFEAALANADRALYVAKHQGRNTLLAWENLSSARVVQTASAR